MKAKIWRVLAQILWDRNELIEKIRPFFEDLSGYNINDNQYFPILKTFSKYQLSVFYKSGIITEEKFNSLIPQNTISNRVQNPNTNNIEEIITNWINYKN